MRASRLDVSHRPPPRPWRHPRSRDLVHRQRAEANDDPGALPVCHSDSLSRANGKVRRGLCRLDVMAQHVLRKQVGGKPVLELTDGNLLFGGCRQVGRIGPTCLHPPKRRFPSVSSSTGLPPTCFRNTCCAITSSRQSPRLTFPFARLNESE